MQLLDTIFYFVVTLGILVFVHELGHFLAAKL
jgi:membrane-associated protease RseP (regulator of RpoE activity)